MKRIISLCCVALICVFSLAAPARADEFDNDQWLDLLDYCVPVGYSDNAFNVSSGAKITYSLPVPNVCHYIDMVIRSSSPFTSIFASNGNSDVSLPLTVVPVTDGLYRVYGSLSGYYFSDLVLTFNFTNASGYGQIYALNLGFAKSSHYDIEAYCEIDAAADYHQVIHYVPTDEINHRIITTDQNWTSNGFSCFVWSDDWRKYDYIDFQFLFSCFSITSISGAFGSTNIPIDVSLVETSPLGENNFFVSIRMDLTGLDRTSGNRPAIFIEGKFDFNTVNMVSFQGCSGYVLLNTTSPLTYFFNNLNIWISNLGDRIVAAVSGNSSSANEFQSQLNLELDRLDQAQAVMDSVTKPAIDQIDVSVDQYVSQADIQVLATPLSIFFEGEIFSKIIIMSILLATVSYTLFGKK